MKEFLYNSWLGFDLSQMSWFRKWYGGKWSRVELVDDPAIKVWIKNSPSQLLSGKVNVISTERHLQELREEDLTQKMCNKKERL